MSILQDNTDSRSQKKVARKLQDQNIRESVSAVKYKFLLMSSQGGVGKTSVVVNLAVTLSRRGLKVGLLDFNFQSPDIHRMLGLELRVAWDANQRYLPMTYSDDLKVASIESVIQARGASGLWAKPLEKSDICGFISSVNWDRLDYLLVDTPPGPGEELLMLVRSIPEARTIIVTAPDKISAERAQDMIAFFKKENIPVFGWIENMRGFLCRHCGQLQELFSTGSGSRAVFLMDIPFLGRIPIDPHLFECIDDGEPFMGKYPDSQAAKAYELIAKKVLEATRWKTHSGQL
jgi:ATP-binding protein involved in chromosome partitioning